MAVSRRAVLTGAAAVSVAGALAACSKDGETSAGGSGGSVSLRFSWWGNDLRNKLTNQVIDMWNSKHPDIQVSGEPGEWGTYWDKFATQVAGNDAPDIIQMDEQYLRDYGARGVLLDLGKQQINTSNFGPGLVDTGKINGASYALPIGVNALSLVANPTVISASKATLPDDKTWTWDTLLATCQAITKGSPKGTYGANNIFGDSALRAWLFQKGKTIFTDTGFGFDASDIQAWLDLMMKYETAAAIPGPAEIAQDYNAPMGQSMFGTGKLGLVLLWSNQISAMQSAVGNSTQLSMLRLPSMDGTSKGANLWFKSGQFISGWSKSKHAAAVAQFIDYFCNDPEAAKILLAERGLPPNVDNQKLIAPLLGEADKKALDYLTALTPDVRAAPVPPPVGASTLQTVLERYEEDVLFGRQTVPGAAEGFFNEMKGMLKS